ncbi:LAMI_0E00584g1_1 [Lachancea mirantina]|uniref:LAMI_0E00584g1_1 n=1 Tax=Lachancea mirantina TaxID=1230905 RepID=A0A1G4JI48_9SACH|nr:LAMI_0E00584g1_1 [Lachancea mirantina]
MSIVNSSSLTAFNSNHELYDKVRPGFDRNKKFLTEFIFDQCLTRGEACNVLELAAGTGKFTKAFLEAVQMRNREVNVTAVDPSQGMLESFQKNIEVGRNVAVYQGSSYSIPLPDNSVDCVIVAQGFHWFADSSSLAEIHRVLNKKTGRLALIWNFDAASAAQKIPNANTKVHISYGDDKVRLYGKIYAETVKELEFNGLIDSSDRVFKLVEMLVGKLTSWDLLATHVYRYDHAVPQYRHGEWRRCMENQNFFDADRAIESFDMGIDSMPKELVFPYWLSRSYITNLSDPEKQAVEKWMSESISKFPMQHLSADGQFVNRFLSTHTYVVPVKNIS